MTYHHHRSHHRCYFSAIQIYSYSGQPSSQLSNITEIRDIHRGVHRSRLREIVFPSSKIPRFSFPPGRWLINLSNLSMPNFTLTTLRGLCNNFPRLKHCDVTIALAEREYTLNIPCTCNVGSRVPPKFLEFSEICDVCEIQTSNTRSHSLRWSQEIWLGAKKILFTYLPRIISLHSLILEYIWNQIQIQLEIFPKRRKKKKKSIFHPSKRTRFTSQLDDSKISSKQSIIEAANRKNDSVNPAWMIPVLPEASITNPLPWFFAISPSRESASTTPRWSIKRQILLNRKARWKNRECLPFSFLPPFLSNRSINERRKGSIDR